MEVLLKVDGRHYLLRQLPDRFHVLAPGPEVRDALPFRECKRGPIYRRPDEDLVFPYTTREPLGFRYTEWYLPLHQFGSLESAVFYPTIWWSDMRVGVRRWSSEATGLNALTGVVAIDHAFINAAVAEMANRGELSRDDFEAHSAAARRIRHAQLELLTARGFQLIGDNYGPSSGWGDLPLGELDLTEGPCPFPLNTDQSPRGG